MDDQVVTIFPAMVAPQPGLERPHARDRCKFLSLRNAFRCGIPRVPGYRRTVPVQFPDRLHAPDVRKTFFRQVPRTALGAGHRGGFARVGHPQNGWQEPETRRFRSPATSNLLLLLSSRSTMRPAISRQIPGHGGVSVTPSARQIRPGTRTENRSRRAPSFLVRKPTKNISDLGHRSVAG